MFNLYKLFSFKELEAKDVAPATTEDGAALSKRPGFSGTLYFLFHLQQNR